MPERPAFWYDKHYEEYKPKIQESNPIYDWVVRELERHRAKSILDIGCGAGMLMKLCQNKGFDCFGFDFSHVAIEICKNHYGLKNAWVGDAQERVNYDGNYDAYIAIEVLEHITEDFVLIDHLSPGILLIFSVPTWNSPEGSHVRCFTTADKVRERYGKILDIKSIDKLKHRWIAVSKVCKKEGIRNE